MAKKKHSPLKHGKMYKVTGGGAIRGFRVNPAGTVEVLVVPGHHKKHVKPKKKRKRKPATRQNFRKHHHRAPKKSKRKK
jgi:hypothetical protein